MSNLGELLHLKYTEAVEARKINEEKIRQRKTYPFSDYLIQLITTLPETLLSVAASGRKYFKLDLANEFAKEIQEIEDGYGFRHNQPAKQMIDSLYNDLKFNFEKNSLAPLTDFCQENQLTLCLALSGSIIFLTISWEEWPPAPTE